MEELNKNEGPKKTTIIIGRQPVIEALENGRALDKILFQQNVSGDSIGRIRKLAQEKNIPIQQVPVEKLNSLSRANHQGCIALAAIVEYMNLQQVIDLVVGNGETPLFIMLDGVTDALNLDRCTFGHRRIACRRAVHIGEMRQVEKIVDGQLIVAQQMQLDPMQADARCIERAEVRNETRIGKRRIAHPYPQQRPAFDERIRNDIER